MKSINKFILLSASISMSILFSCQNSGKQTNAKQSEVSSDQHHFGQTITKENAKETLELPNLFVTDSVAVKLTGKVVNVCQHSGCWLTLAFGKEELMVNLKDQAFSVPKDISGKTAWVDGIAYRELIDVETLKQIADENGKSQEEIDAITEPVYDYTVEVTGVIVE
jgi:hypothetical protein